MILSVALPDYLGTHYADSKIIGTPKLHAREQLSVIEQGIDIYDLHPTTEQYK